MSILEHNFISERRISRNLKQIRISENDVDYRIVKPEIKKDYIQTKLKWLKLTIKEDYDLMVIALKGVLKELGEITTALDLIEVKIIKDKERNKVLV